MIEGQKIRIVWQTAGGRTNVVQTAPRLANGFTDLSPLLVIPGSGDMLADYLDASGATNALARFYRIRTAP